MSSLQLSGLSGRTAVVTGGGSGVGAAIALALAEVGMNLCLIGRRLELLEATAAEARKLGVMVSCCHGDLASGTGQHNVAARLVGDLADVDVLVHSAAAYIAAAVEAAPSGDFDLQFQTNVRAPFVLTQALLPKLKARQGQVVFINSSSGIRAKPNCAQYDATKHALKALADSLRDEINAAGVRVLSVYLGRTATPMQARIHEVDGIDYRPELLLQPADVAAVIVSTLSLPRTAEVTDVHIRPMIKAPATAVEHRVEAELCRDHIVEIALVNGRTLRVADNIDPEALARVVAVLDGPSS